MRSDRRPGACQEFRRELAIGRRDGSRQRHAADHGGNDGNRLLSGLRLLEAARNELSGDFFHIVGDAAGKLLFDDLVLVSDLRYEGGHRAAATGLVAVGNGQIEVERPAQRRIVGPLGQTLLEGLPADFSGKLRLGAEVTVERAVRQAGPLHDVDHTDIVEAAFAEQAGRGLDNRAMMRRILFFGDLHARLTAPSDGPGCYIGFVALEVLFMPPQNFIPTKCSSGVGPLGARRGRTDDPDHRLLPTVEQGRPASALGGVGR